MPLNRFLEITKALSDRSRVRALAALRDGELCLCHLVTLLDLAPSTLSQHMNLLFSAKLVERRKEGRWHWFRLAGPRAPADSRRAVEAALAAVDRDPEIEQDRRKLRALSRIDREELTACYRTCADRSAAAPGQEGVVR